MSSATVAARGPDAAPPADRAIVRLGGALDTAAAPALRDRLLGILHQGTRLLILDLSRVLRCDLAGLNVLISTQRRARLLGISVCLAGPTLPVANLLRSTGVDRRFTLYPDLSSAVAGKSKALRSARRPQPGGPAGEGI